MDIDNNLEKQVEAAEYKAELLKAELTAVTSSKAYKLAKAIGIVKNEVKNDPVGFMKKAAKAILKDPKKVAQLVKRGQRQAFIEQSVTEQTNRYQEWIILNEPDETMLSKQRKQSGEFKYKPLISLVTPVYNPPADVLEELIETVLEQTYPNFELCLWDDYGKSQAVIDLLEKYEQTDPRVRFFKFIDNQGIAGASNRILEKVEGEYIALLDHDDTLSPNALYENVKMLNEQPYDFLYSDKDKIDLEGNRFDPLFKPDYSPEMMLNVNYLTHLNVMRTSIVRDIGGWDPDTNGAQDWDLFLRVVRASKLIGHIPKVLYHWRVIESSTALSIETKPYALAGQRKSVDKYLEGEHIPAKSYHEKTELFLDWQPEALDSQPFVFIRYSSLADTLRMIRAVKRVTEKPTFGILVDTKLPASQVDVIIKHTKSKILPHTEDNMVEVITTYCAILAKKRKTGTVIVVRDYIRFPKKDIWYKNLTGWLTIKEVGAVSGRLVDRNDHIVDSGGIITKDGQYFPIFSGYPRYYQSYLGNAEWVRNLSAISPNYCALKLETLREYTGKKGIGSFDDYIFWLSRQKRIVLSPQSTATLFKDRNINPVHPFKPVASKKNTNFLDKFGNINMSKTDPMRLFIDERRVGIDPPAALEPIDRYQHDAIILASTFDIDQQTLEANKKIVKKPSSLKNVQSVAWFLPSFDAVYAGLMNIFYFANFLAMQKKLQTTVYILKDREDASTEKALVVAAFPELKSAIFKGIRPDQVTEIGQYDIGIATQWASAFPLAHAQKIARKCYFIQDNEANFYPKGSISSLVELSYQFGFMAIANTEGLLKLYQDKYDGTGVLVKSVVDLSAYHPREDKYYVPKKTYKVFFYARPNMPRNAFELGVAGLKKLKQELGKDVEVITAGAPWDPKAYGVEGLFTNLGKIDYESVPKLYRSVDAGLMFMFSGHPGVTASELMASGCPVVVNEYDDVTWHDLYQHEKTCLVTKATASEVARNIRRCLEDQKLRKTLIDGGLKKVEKFYTGYEKSQEEAYAAIIKGSNKK